MASARPYANYLHSGTSSLKFLQARCSSWCPTNSIKALKARHAVWTQEETTLYIMLLWMWTNLCINTDTNCQHILVLHDSDSKTANITVKKLGSLKWHVASHKNQTGDVTNAACLHYVIVLQSWCQLTIDSIKVLKMTPFNDVHCFVWWCICAHLILLEHVKSKLNSRVTTNITDVYVTNNTSVVNEDVDTKPSSFFHDAAM